MEGFDGRDGPTESELSGEQGGEIQWRAQLEVALRDRAAEAGQLRVGLLAARAALHDLLPRSDTGSERSKMIKQAVSDADKALRQ